MLSYGDDYGYDLKNLIRFGKNGIHLFLEQYKTFDQTTIQKYNKILNILIDTLFDFHMFDMYVHFYAKNYEYVFRKFIKSTDKYNEYDADVQYLNRPPRIHITVEGGKPEEGKLLVASCLTCGFDGNELHRERNNPERVFCDIKCQKDFYVSRKIK